MDTVAGQAVLLEEPFGTTACRADARIPFVLAWRHVTRHRLRFAMTVAGVAMAVFLMVFQGSLLVGFIRAAGTVVDAAGGDIWIVNRGVPCFDFPAPMPRRYLDTVRGVDGVRDALPLAVGLSPLTRHDGEHRGVVLVGLDRRLSSGLPVPAVRPGGAPVPDGVVVDESTRALLGIRHVPASLEIAGRRAPVVRSVRGFGTFLGSPYVFGDIAHVREILRQDPDEMSYGVIVVDEPTAAPAQVAALRARLPNVDVLTSREFAGRSAWFWIVQTGAGGAILVAALLGMVVGFVIVLQTMYASTAESEREFATLKALGAPASSIRTFVGLQAVCIGLLGSTVGLLALEPLAGLARAYLVSWVVTPVWLRMAGACAGVVLATAASLSASRRAASVDPMRVLRG